MIARIRRATLIGMVVDFEFDGGVCILRMSGRFATGSDVEYLRGKTDELKLKGCRRIVADLTQVPYIDSTGIGFLLAIYAGIVRDPESRFAIANPNHRVREVLSLTKLATILPTFDDVPSALASLR